MSAPHTSAPARAGCRTVQVIDAHDGTPFPMLVMYPSDAPENTERLGPYSLEVALNAAPKPGRYPLVLISHGSGSAFLAYRTLAHFLARHGFVVGIPEHPFNNRSDNSLVDTLDNLANRPRQLRCAIDWFYGSAELADSVKPDDVAIIGHSMGGYTALACAGGRPTGLARESPDGAEHVVDVIADARVKALVLLAPASVWYRNDGALRDVHCPILMLFGEQDAITPFRFHGRLILDGLPTTTLIEHRIIDNAGHFSFLSAFPESMCDPAFAPSQDRPGFDRAAYHATLHAEVLAFLRRAV